MSKITKIEQLTPDRRNANKGRERGTGLIEKSFREYGAGRSILVDREGRVIAGNKSLESCASIGMEDVIVVQTDGTKLVAVQRTDLDLETDPRARQLAIADNRTAELNLDWDGEVLKDLMTDTDLAPFFSEAELRNLGVIDLGDDGPAASLERAKELQAKWSTAPGQIWEIPSLGAPGKAHRLMCADSTNEANVGALLRGERPFLCATDMPYGVEYSPDWRPSALKQNQDTYALGKVQNDGRNDWSAAFKLFPGDVLYTWHAGIYAGECAAMIHGLGFEVRAQIIWAKQSLVISRGHYHWQHEPAFYSVRKGCKSNWHGDRKQSTLWQVANLNSSSGGEHDAGDEITGHSTQKPVELFRRPILNHTAAGDSVYEPFAGSGTCLVAAEQTGRIAYGMEIDASFTAIILQRMKDMGLEPVLVGEHKNAEAAGEAG